jgi:hypothetical protein
MEHKSAYSPRIQEWVELLQRQGGKECINQKTLPNYKCVFFCHKSKSLQVIDT